MKEAEGTNQSIKKSNYISSCIPYSDSTTLSAFSKDNNIVNYELVRKITLLELDATGFRDEMNWYGYTLSKMPVTIYGFDSKPKYWDLSV